MIAIEQALLLKQPDGLANRIPAHHVLNGDISLGRQRFIRSSGPAFDLRPQLCCKLLIQRPFDRSAVRCACLGHELRTFSHKNRLAGASRDWTVRLKTCCLVQQACHRMTSSDILARDTTPTPLVSACSEQPIAILTSIGTLSSGVTISRTDIWYVPACQRHYEVATQLAKFLGISRDISTIDSVGTYH